MRQVVAKAFLIELKRRPWWMTLIWLFCIYMTFVYLPFDLFIKSVASDQEVWFGFVLHGWWAKATEPLHWLIYGFGSYGFWKMRRWMHPWAALYAFQVAIAMGVYNIVDPRGLGYIAGLVVFLIFMVPTIALWRHRKRFEN